MTPVRSAPEAGVAKRTGRNTRVGELEVKKSEEGEEAESGEKDEAENGEKEEKEEKEEEEEPLEPSVAVEDLGGWRRRLTVEVAAEKVKGEYEKQLKDLSHSAQVPGFRRGRVPRKLLLNRFGEALEGDVKARLLSRGLDEALEANDLEPVSEPLFGPERPAEKEEAAAEGEDGGGKGGEEGSKSPTPDEVSAEYLKDLAIEPEDAFSFEFTVEVKPTFDLPEYKGLKLTRSTRPVTDERVEQYIGALRRREADFEPVEEGAIEPGDRLTVRASMECEGETAWEAENQVAHVTDQALLGLPGFVKYEEIEGMTLGGDKTVDVKVADGFEQEELRGKDARLTFTINEIKRPVLPPLDDEAAQKLGAPDAQSLRQQARERLELQARADGREELEREMTDKLLAAADFDLPDGLLDRAAGRQEVRQMVRLAQMGIPPDKLEEEHRASIRTSARESTGRGLKLNLILERIAEVEGIDTTDDELENQIYRYAQAQRRTPVSVRSDLERSGALDDLRSEIRSSKVVNFIVEQADITDAQEDPDAGRASEGGAR